MGEAARKGKQPEAAQVTLRAVAVADDGSLVLARRAGAKSGGFRLRLDDRLTELIEEARARATRPQEPPETPEAVPAPVRARVASALSPKEIQALLRRGLSPAAIAKRAGVDVAWVERFQGPILWERSGMATRAQRAVVRRARLGDSRMPLGESVAANLRGRGLDPSTLASVGWDAVKRPKRNAWVVTCRYEQRGRSHRATWEYDPATDEVSALDKLAATLGWVEPIRRRRAG